MFSGTRRTKRCLVRSAATTRRRRRCCPCPPEATSTADKVKACRTTRMKKVMLDLIRLWNWFDWEIDSSENRLFVKRQICRILKLWYLQVSVIFQINNFLITKFQAPDSVTAVTELPGPLQVTITELPEVVR